MGCRAFPVLSESPPSTEGVERRLRQLQTEDLAPVSSGDENTGADNAEPDEDAPSDLEPYEIHGPWGLDTLDTLA